MISFKSFKLSDEDIFYLKSVAVPKWARQRDENIVQIWFETFLEHLSKIGYKIVTEREWDLYQQHIKLHQSVSKLSDEIE